jgi:hypothetical protein
MTINIPSELKGFYKEAVDALMLSELTSEECEIVYPPKHTQCDNCLPGPMGSGGNVYRNGGPRPFAFGLCPYCQGRGFKEEESTETIRLRVHFVTDRSKQELYAKINSINIEVYDAQIIGYMDDLPKIKRASRILLVNQNAGHKRISCKVIGEPNPWGFGKDLYFSAYVGTDA